MHNSILEINPTGMPLWVIAVIAGFSLLIVFFLVWVKRYKRCPSDRILVVYGRVNGGSAKCIQGGAAFIWPIIQDYAFLDLTPISLDVELKNALSKQNIRVDIPSSFTIGIATEPAVMNNAAERLLGLTNDKIKEIKSLFKGPIELLSLEDIKCTEEIPETSETIAGNALQKAKYIYENYGYNCFADDTGLEIKSLNGEPGIFSARYAGEKKSAEANMNKVLSKLNNTVNRTAQFKTVIALIIDGKTTLFEGVAKGGITTSKSGTEGFGYDPIFKPEGYEITFSEMSLEEKNKISHRAKAIRKLAEYLSLL